jgi:long-chain acyl-CoA synthetase
MAASNVYDNRPWTALYDPGLPHDVEARYHHGLSMFRAAVQHAGESPAIHYFDRTISYTELDELTDALASALRELGVSAGDRCAAYLQNVPQFPIVMIACWKAGAIMASVNPMWRHDEVRTVLRDSGAVALVTLESLWREVAKEIVGDTDVRICLTTCELDFLNGSPPPLLGGVERDRDPATRDLLELIDRFRGQRLPDPELTGDHVAFLTYTSGTTGPPKGAMNTHGSVTFNAETYRQWFHLDETDVVLGVAPLFHITGLVAHLATALHLAIPVVLGYRFDVSTVLELIERYRTTTTVASITVFIAFMNSPDADRRDISSLRKVYSGGAPIAPATVEAYEQRFGVYVHPIYGLTETTSPSHAVPFDRRAPVDETSGALSVGIPTFNVVSRVVDDDDRDLSPGEVGEIVIAGPGVVPGYWEQPEETEHAMPDGQLHTGDVGFMDEQGWFYIVDRKKDLINASGYKVWPREVEDVLYSHPAVLEAAVIGVPDPYRGETVKAFISLKAGMSAEESELITFCRDHMAAYKYPRAIEFLEELPKTASGKILRRDLRERAQNRMP